MVVCQLDNVYCVCFVFNHNFVIGMLTLSMTLRVLGIGSVCCVQCWGNRNVVRCLYMKPPLSRSYHVQHYEQILLMALVYVLTC